jgi:predicted oxidoreductase (fatty acid repression mutant protein)
MTDKQKKRVFIELKNLIEMELEALIKVELSVFNSQPEEIVLLITP